MSEPNPYESPREPELLTTEQVVKRAVGFGLVLLLTPPAVLTAFILSCSASRIVPSLRHPLHNIVLQSAIWFGMPLIALIGMIACAISIRRLQTKDRWGKTDKVLLLTPVIVAVTFAFSLIATNLFVESPINNKGNLSIIIAIGLIIFVVPPSAALGGMLWYAWRAR